MSTKHDSLFGAVIPALGALALFFISSVSFAQPRQLTTLDEGFEPNPIVLSGTSGGSQDATAYGTSSSGPCRGWVGTRADHRIEITAAFSDLEVAVQSAGDTTLIIDGPTGTLCNDDSDGFNPAIRGAFPVGNYRVWVGSYVAEQQLSYQLSVWDHSSRLGPLRPLPLPVSRPSLETSGFQSQSDSLSLRSGFEPDPAVVTGRSGGSLDSSVMGLGTGCVGFVERTPDHVITLNETFEDLRFSVESIGDTTMLIWTGSAWRCNDDAYGLNPAVVGRFEAGVYRIWIGSYRSQDTFEYQLSIDDLQHEQTAEADPPESDQLEFEGAFEDTPVVFLGRTRAEVHEACTGYLASNRSLAYMDDITVFGTSYHNGPAWWYPQNVCAMAALNARPVDGSRRPRISGQVEGLPFAVYGRPQRVREAVFEWMPSMLEGQNIDHVVIGSDAYHNGPSWWTPQTATWMVYHNLPHSRATVQVSGEVEGIPFTFGGDSRADLQPQCWDFWEHLIGHLAVDDVTINGAAYHNGPGWWGRDEVCMMIMGALR